MSNIIIHDYAYSDLLRNENLSHDIHVASQECFITTDYHQAQRDALHHGRDTWRIIFGVDKHTQKPVTMLQMEFMGRSDRGEPIYAIWSICTTHSYRGKGLLRRLMQHIATRYPKSHFYLYAADDKTENLNMGARIEIYTKLGFYIPAGNSVSVHATGTNGVITHVHHLPEKKMTTYTINNGIHPRSLYSSSSRIQSKDFTCIVDSRERGCKMVSTTATIQRFLSANRKTKVHGQNLIKTKMTTRRSRVPTKKTYSFRI